MAVTGYHRDDRTVLTHHAAALATCLVVTLSRFHTLIKAISITRQREVVDAFLAAAPTEIRGATAIANRAVKGGARAAQPALVNGAVGVIVAPRGRLLMVLRFTITHGKIIEIEAVADPNRLRQLDLAILND
jgi:RNA polymerase sigma-70 factor (ECF subfamily)